LPNHQKGNGAPEQIARTESSEMARALHYVFKIGNRNSAYEFFIKTLGMKVLRHEEFEEGCKATCNGPYDGKWSKTMVGYGEEDTHFVIELTYNYPIGSYKLGNDFKVSSKTTSYQTQINSSISIKGIYIQSSDVFKRCQSEKNSKMVSNELLQLADPDGHCFFIKDGHRRVDPVYKLALNTPNLNATVDYWSEILGMQILSRDESHCLLSYGDDQVRLFISF
uniref:Glyoxalase 1 (inferred by orthology to a C. elegans protein) n=1 Tax=Anisakis simplex TaxID=6269 RepID=A0A0M3J3I6_ANISI